MSVGQRPVLAQFDARTDSFDSIWEAFSRDGAAIVHHMLESETVVRLREELAATTRSTSAGTKSTDSMVQKFWGSQTKRFTRLASRSKTFRDDVLVHPILRQVADREILPHCAAYWMNTGQVMIIGPGQSAQWLHRDADNWPLVLGPNERPVTISCMFALTEFTAEAGATRVVPGSHRWDDFSRVPNPDDVIQAVMPAGSALIYSGTVLHGGGENTTADVWREGMHLSYLVGWLTPEEAGCLGMSEEVARTLTPLQQQLLGWRCYDGDMAAARLWTLDYEDIPVALDWNKGASS
jgi:ectoine hydroxylase-related dioxygenase (phytanoyl-CoA dioxygenase family)